jgi:hypothetical protein
MPSNYNQSWWKKQAQLTISGIVDTLDEDEEAITLETSATNANLSVTSPISIQLTDINNPLYSLAKQKLGKFNYWRNVHSYIINSFWQNTSIEFTLKELQLKRLNMWSAVKQ